MSLELSSNRHSICVNIHIASLEQEIIPLERELTSFSHMAEVHSLHEVTG